MTVFLYFAGVYFTLNMIMYLGYLGGMKRPEYTPLNLATSAVASSIAATFAFLLATGAIA